MKKGKKILLVLSTGLLIAGCSCSQGEIIESPVIENNQTTQEQNLAQLYQDSVLSTVAIYGYNTSEDYSIGTGIIYKEEGLYAYIITNAHVLYNKQTSIKYSNTIDVMLSNNKRVKADFIGMERDEDIAVIRIEKSNDYKVAKFIKDDLSTQVGDFVYAIGNPRGDSFALTDGVISKTKKKTSISYIAGNDKTTFVYNSTATINPGNSGGPLFNKKGEVIAINAMYPRENNPSEPENRDSNYSIPINHCLTVADYIVSNTSTSNKPFKRATIGIQGISINSLSVDQKRIKGIKVDNGIFVTKSIYPGIDKDSTIITNIGKYKVDTMDDLEYLLFTKYLTSNSIELTITDRTGIRVDTVNVTLA